MALFKRGKTWWYEFTLDGVRIRESARTRVRAIASQKESLRRAECIAGRSRSNTQRKSLGFSEFAYGEFSAWCANEHRDKPSTYARYMRSVKALADFFGNKPLGTIGAGGVEKYKLYRSQQKRKNARDGRLVSPAAVNRDLAVFRILFNYAIRLGKAEGNPVHGVKFLKESNLHMRVLSAEEEMQYLHAASPLLKDVATLILETGMRPGEVCNLGLADVDLRRRSLHVRAGKTVNARRSIPLTKRALAILEKRAAMAKAEWMFSCPFDSTRPVSEVRKAHNAAVRRSGTRVRFRLYDLRHTALSRMAMSGMDLATLKEIAGHSQIQMTMRYIHPTPEHKSNAISKFESFMRLQDCTPSNDDQHEDGLSFVNRSWVVS